MYLVLAFPSIGKTPLGSLVIPGSYQIRTQHRRGYVYLFFESVFLGTYFYTKKEMDAVKTSYVQFARDYATGTVNTSSNFLNLLEKYESYDEYYEMLYREARQIYPDDPQEQDTYVREHLSTTVKWQWASKDAWYSYQDKRRFYRELSNRTVFLLGFMLTNHLASFIDGVITERLLKNKVNVRTTLAPEAISTELSINL